MGLGECEMDYPTTIDRSLNLTTSISYRVKLARELKKMSQIQLSKAVGISQGTLSDLERGKNRSSLELTKIADVLGVSPIWLSEGRGDMYNKAKALKLVDTERLVSNKITLLKPSEVAGYLLNSEDFENSIDSFISAEGFALEVADDKMQPEFNPGDIIIVDTELQHQTGDYVIILDKQSIKFVQIVEDGADWLLKPINERYPITTLQTNQRLIGVVRAKQKTYR